MKHIVTHAIVPRFAAVAVALFSTVSGLHAASDDRPNILWIIVEDASCHLGPYGETVIKTPNLDALADQGVTFTAASVTAPVCSASRSAMITGMNQATLGVHNHRSQMDSGKGMGSPVYHDSYHLPIKMIPELFKQAGYHTAQNSGVKHEGKRGKTDYNFIWNRFEYDSAHWLDCPNGKPFFAVLQLKGGKSRKNDSGKVDPDSVTLPPYYPEHPVFKKDWADYLGSWLQVDREVGTAMQQLEDAGRLNNTAVFFMTDHGVSQLRGKQYVYEEGTRVPLIMRLPKGRFAGSTRNDLVNQIDVSATSLGLAGISIPSHIQGRDFLAKDYVRRKAVFSARDRCDETVNLAGDAQYKQTLLTLRTQLYDQMVSSRDLGLIPEPILEDLGKRYGNKFHILTQPENKTLVRDLINIIEAGEKQDVTRLLKGLKDEDPSICYWAATWLGNRKMADAGNALLMTTGHSDPTVRVAAALALSRLGRPDDGAAVILKTIEDDNWLAGLYAIRALEWSGNRTPAAQAAVIRALDSPYEFTRRIAKRLSTQF